MLHFWSLCEPISRWVSQKSFFFSKKTSVLSTRKGSTELACNMTYTHCLNVSISVTYWHVVISNEMNIVPHFTQHDSWERNAWRSLCLDLQLRCQENCIICLTDYDDSSQARIWGDQNMRFWEKGRYMFPPLQECKWITSGLKDSNIFWRRT